MMLKTSTTDSLAALLGTTNPLASAPGTIRGDFAIVRHLFAIIPLKTADVFLGRWPQRLPRFRRRRECQEGDRLVVQTGGDP